MTAEFTLPAIKTVTPEVWPFYDKQTNTFSYVVKDPHSTACAVVDSVLNLDYNSGTITHDGANAIIQHVKDHGLKVEWLIETHVHADHLSAAPYIQMALGGKLAIGDQIHVVQQTFGKVFNAGTEFARDGSQFDHLFTDSEVYRIGTMEACALHTPGHTPACMTHVIGDAAFVGDTIFMPDVGTARADFPGGNAGILYQSIEKVLSLPVSTRLFMCHDYSPDGREPEYESSVADELANNIHVHRGTDKETFVAMRETRDRTLDMPHLILPSLQVNMRAGHLPPAEDNGMVYLKVPINAFV